MLLFVDSFDNYTPLTTAALIKWQAFVNSSAQSVFQIDTVGSRTPGGQNLYFGGTPGQFCYLQKTLAANKTTLIVGFALRVEQFDGGNIITLLQFLDAAASRQISVNLTPLGFIECRQISGETGTIIATSSVAPIIQTGVYYFIELKITFDGAAGAIKLNVTGNGATQTVINSTGLNTAPSGTNSARSFRLGCVFKTTFVPVAWVLRFDDLYVCDSSGALNNDILGDCRAFCAIVNGPGSTTNFTPVGAATDWQCVNELSQDGDTTYAIGITATNKDLYTHTPTPATTSQVLGVQLCGVMRKDDTGPKTAANTVKSGATLQDGVTNTLSLNYAGYLDILETDPATGIPFTKAGVDAMEIGAKIIA